MKKIICILTIFIFASLLQFTEVNAEPEGWSKPIKVNTTTISKGVVNGDIGFDSKNNTYIIWVSDHGTVTPTYMIFEKKYDINGKPYDEQEVIAQISSLNGGGPRIVIDSEDNIHLIYLVAIFVGLIKTSKIKKEKIEKIRKNLMCGEN